MAGVAVETQLARRRITSMHALVIAIIAMTLAGTTLRDWVAGQRTVATAGRRGSHRASRSGVTSAATAPLITTPRTRNGSA